MRTKSVAILASALALGVLAVSAEAQQHKATRLGNPATRFAKPLKKADDLRVLLRSEKMKADVAAILNEVGWKGNHEDLDRAAASAEISAVQIAPGTRIPFMSSRTNKKPHALMDVLWAGKKPIDAFAFEFSSNCQRYRLVTPKACSNFWVEDLGKDTTDPKCNVAPPPPPVVSVSGASETCVTQPVEYSVTVRNPPADNNVKLYVNGKELVSDKLTNGAFKFTFTGAPTPGAYEVKAVSGGVTGTTSVQVKPCLPTCGITATPLPAKAGKPFTVDLSGSRVAAGVKGGVKSAKVEVLDPKGTVVDTFEMGTAGMTRSDFVIKRGGIHTLRAVVTDEAGQVSTNACTAQVDVKGGVPFYVGAYFGKERFVHDEVDGHDDGFVGPRRDLRRAPRLRGRLPADARRPRAVRRPARHQAQLRGQRALGALRRRGGQLRGRPRLPRRRAQLVGHRQGLGRDRPPRPGRLRPRQGRQVAAGRPGPRAVLRVRRPVEQLPDVGRHPLPAEQLEVVA